MGRFPERLFRPEEMRRELRGGGAALRQVNHILGPDLPAERLILYEVYTPSGRFSGWPPHRHDGIQGSAYMEEIYLYRVEPKGAFAIHVNYDDEGLSQVFLARDLDLVLVPRGYHPVAAPQAPTCTTSTTWLGNSTARDGLRPQWTTQCGLG